MTGGVAASIEPTLHIWTFRKQPWLSLPAAVPSYPEAPPMDVFIALASAGQWQRMVAADDLLGLGLMLMKNAKQDRSAVGAAVEFRDGLIIAFLALRPLRLKNLSELRIDNSLVPTGNGYRIVLDGGAMKNGSPLEFEWPEFLLPMLEEWLLTHREVLQHCRNRWARPIRSALWVSSMAHQ